MEENIPDAFALIDGVSDTTAALTEGLDTSQSVSQLGNLVHELWGKLTIGRLLSSLILLLVCLLIVRLIMALVKKITIQAKMEPRVGRYVIRGVKMLLYLLMALLVAGNLGINVTSLVALLSVFGLAISLAVQDTLSNIAGGIVLIFAKPFVLGDYVATDDGEGTVTELGLTHTKLDTYSGQRLMLPNSKLSAGKIVNYTVLGVRRADHAIGVSYSCEPDKVKAACLKAIARTPDILDTPAPQAVMTAYRDSSMEYHVRFWAKTDCFWNANFRSLEEIYRAFAEDGIKITYNHLNVHIMDEVTTKEK